MIKEKKYALGIDIGSVTLKLALLDEKDNPIYSSYEKHYSRPLQVLLSALKTLKAKIPVQQIHSAAVTGSGKNMVKEILAIQSVNEIVAQSVAVSHFIPEAKTIIEIGGQDSKYIRLGNNNGSNQAMILSQEMNDICAAGTGVFIEQQADRMNIPLEDFANRVQISEHPAFVAGRCAVFAKTDIIHLLQEGTPEPDIVSGVCLAVARNYIARFSKGKKFELPIVFQGGLAANKGVVKAFEKMLKISERELIVPKNFKVMVAIGSALISREYKEQRDILLDQSLDRIGAHLGKRCFVKSGLEKLPPLIKDIHNICVFPQVPALENENIFIGIDTGSTSTCVAILNKDGGLLAKSYTLNKGTVVASVNSALKEIRGHLAPELKTLKVAGVGVTGSGRHLISQYIGADVIKDEITAQATAAVQIMPQVDTVFEIGGQDSKYIRISKGRVIDFEMNKVCSAGTGSFLQEQATKLKEEIHDLSSVAFHSQSPVNLGSRCTVFMESDLVNYQQMGFSKVDLIAGLSYSVARNYLEKVVAGKPIGNQILILGGVAFNESVISAFQHLLQKRLIVPTHHEISAAIGIALMAKETLTDRKGFQTKFRGFEVTQEKYKISSFQCDDCPNNCRINKVNTNSHVFYYGGACGKYEESKRGGDYPNLFNERNALLMSYHKPPSDHGTEVIGIPRSHLYYELFPLYCIFLQELGFEVMISEYTNKDIITNGLRKTAIDNCFASKVVYGHVHDLMKRGVDKIFLPSVIEFERRVKDMEHNYSCQHIQAIPSLIQIAFPSLKVISPVFYRHKSDLEWQKELIRTGQELGKSKKLVDRAVKKADRALRSFREKCEALGKQLLETLTEDIPILVVMGKYYNMCDPKLNLNIVEKLLNLEVIPIPFDCLPLSEQALPLDNYLDMVWSSGQDLIRAAKVVINDRRLYPLYIVNFACGPDSFTTKYMNELFRDKSFLTLEVDEHTSDVGVTTRIEAFLNSIQKKKDVPDFHIISSEFKPFIPSLDIKQFDRLLYIPNSFHSCRVIAASFESIGIRTKILPPHDKETERLGRMYTSGTECLTYIMDVGDAVKMTQDPEFHPDKTALFLPSSNLACRISLFPTSIKLVLRDIGYPQVPVIAPRVSMDKDEIRKLFGIKFVRNIFRGMLAVELLARRLTETRPYEINRGESDLIFQQSVDKICAALAKNGFWTDLDKVVNRFDNIKLDLSEQRPIIGLVGDDYTRSNSFANNNFIQEIETLGGEVWNVSIWSNYLEFQRGMKPQNMFKRGRYGEFMFDMAKSMVGRIDGSRICKAFKGRLKCYPDPDFAKMMNSTAQYLSEKSDPLTIIALSHVLHLIDHGVDGIANLVGFQCMIYAIVQATVKSIYEKYGNLPVLTLSCDFQERIHQKNRLEAFMHQVKQYRKAKENHRKKNYP